MVGTRLKHVPGEGKLWNKRSGENPKTQGITSLTVRVSVRNMEFLGGPVSLTTIYYFGTLLSTSEGEDHGWSVLLSPLVPLLFLKTTSDSELMRTVSNPIFLIPTGVGWSSPQRTITRTSTPATVTSLLKYPLFYTSPRPRSDRESNRRENEVLCRVRSKVVSGNDTQIRVRENYVFLRTSSLFLSTPETV